jgi:hypothetical protein
LRSRLGPILLDVAAGWAETTEEDGPLTLVRQSEDATGSLQFSVALYESGREPEVTMGHLTKMLREAGVTHGLGEVSDEKNGAGRLLSAAGSFHSEGSFYRIWYVSDGRNVAFVTYNTPQGTEGKELPDCEAMVASIEFPARTTPGAKR